MVRVNARGDDGARIGRRRRIGFHDRIPDVGRRRDAHPVGRVGDEPGEVSACGVPSRGGRRKDRRLAYRGKGRILAQLHLEPDRRGLPETRNDDRNVDGVVLHRDGRGERESPVRRDRRQVDGAEPLEEGIGRKPRGCHQKPHETRRHGVGEQVVLLAGAGRDGAEILDTGPSGHEVRSAVHGVRERVEFRPRREIRVGKGERESRRAEYHARGIDARERFAGRDAQKRAVAAIGDVLPAGHLVRGDSVGVPSGAEEPGAAGAAAAVAEAQIHVLPTCGFRRVAAMGEGIVACVVLQDGRPVHDVVAVVVNEFVKVVGDAGAHVHLSDIAPRVVAAPCAGGAGDGVVRAGRDLGHHGAGRALHARGGEDVGRPVARSRQRCLPQAGTIDRAAAGGQGSRKQGCKRQRKRRAGAEVLRGSLLHGRVSSVRAVGLSAFAGKTAVGACAVPTGPCTPDSSGRAGRASSDLLVTAAGDGRPPVYASARRARWRRSRRPP